MFLFDKLIGLNYFLNYRSKRNSGSFYKYLKSNSIVNLILCMHIQKYYGKLIVKECNYQNISCTSTIRVMAIELVFKCSCSNNHDDNENN